MGNKDPDLIAKNACVEALFSSVTGSDPFLSDSLRAGIDCALTGETGTPAPFDAFMRKAMELLRRRGTGFEGAVVFQVNLRSRPYEPLWTRAELVQALKPMTGCRSSVLVVTGLQEAVRRTLPRRGRRMLAGEAVAEARRYIDALAARFSAGGCRMTILYLD